MRAKVFISCGQATSGERRTAAAIERWFRERGFDPYVAIQAQSLADINSGIIDQLQRSDLCIFIDLRRERLVRNEVFFNPFKRYPRRGSLFTNQELAIAFLLRFDNVVFLQQEGIERNGLLQYMASNATRFKRLEDVLPLMERLVAERRWDPSYTRHLSPGESRWSEPIRYGDHTGQRNVRVFYIVYPENWTGD